MYEWNDGTDVYLMHHGTKGQKWGIRRYQNPDGTLTALGRARLGLKGTYDGAKNAAKNIKNSIKQAHLKSQRKRNLKKARKAKAEKEAEEKRIAAEQAEEKKKIADAIASGNAAEINKYRDKLSTDEINLALNRISAVERLQKASEGPSKTDLAFKKLSDISDKMDTGIKFYNNLAKLSNGFLGTDLQLLDGKTGSKVKQELESAELDLDKKREENRKAKAAADYQEELAKKERLANEKTEKANNSTSNNESKSEKKEETKSEQKSEPKKESKKEEIPHVKAEPVYSEKEATSSKSESQPKTYMDVKYEDVTSSSTKADSGWVTTQYGALPIGLISANTTVGLKYLADPDRR